MQQIFHRTIAHIRFIFTTPPYPSKGHYDTRLFSSNILLSPAEHKGRHVSSVIRASDSEYRRSEVRFPVGEQKKKKSTAFVFAAPSLEITLHGGRRDKAMKLAPCLQSITVLCSNNSLSPALGRVQGSGNCCCKSSLRLFRSFLRALTTCCAGRTKPSFTDQPHSAQRVL